MNKEQADQWLKAKTFQCALGRVSPQQCEALRKRPRFGEVAHLPRLPLFMPRECEHCTEWQEKIASLRGMNPRKSVGICKVDACNEPAKVKGMCKRHYAQWYYNNNRQIGKRIRERSERMSVCEDCGKEFQSYKHGVATIKNVCSECLQKRVRQGQLKSFVHEENEGKRSMLLRLPFYPELPELLREAAVKHFRTPELQALAYIVEGLERDGIGKKLNKQGEVKDG